MPGFKKDSADSDVASMLVTLRDVLDRAERQKNFFDQYTQAQMNVLNGMTQADYDANKAKVNAVDLLRRIGYGIGNAQNTPGDILLHELERFTGTN